MKFRYFILFLIICSSAMQAQTGSTGLNVGDKAPPLVLTNQQNASQSFSFPYQNKLMLIHFWSSSVSRSKPFLPRIYDLYERYSGVAFRNAEGFEVLTVAIQSDKTAWNQDIKDYGIDKLLNTIVVKGYNDMYIKTFKINQLSVTMLIDENGIVVAINPTQLQLEDILDGKKNSPPNTKDIKGRLLLSENTSDMVKNQKMVLMNKFRDTLSRTTTDNNGQFTFHEVKYLPEYLLAIDTMGSMTGKPRACLAPANGPVFSSSTKTGGHLEFALYPNDLNKLTGAIPTGNSGAQKSAISFNANISFKKGTAELEPSSFAELDKTATLLNKNKDYTVEIISHTDSQGNDADNLELSKKRSSAVKNYLVTKDIAPARMKPIGKGETEIKNKCKNGVPCTEEEHLENVRTELKFYK